MRCLADCSGDAVTEAVQVVAPELSRFPVRMPETRHSVDEIYRKASAALGEQYIAKFAWSQPAALRLAREIRVLTALRDEVPFLPEVVASSTDPLLLITRRVPGTSLFQVAAEIDRDVAGRQLARFLAALHALAARERTEAAIGPLTGPTLPPDSPDTFFKRAPRWIRPDQGEAVRRWCGWAAEVLAAPGPSVLVHGDFHGDNQVWQGDRLRLVVDFETVGAAEPEYDLRGIPGTGPGVELVAAVLRHYEEFTGRRLSPERVMAWHLRQALHDLVWRSEAGLGMADGGTVAGLGARLRAFGCDAGT
jgi:aminoglycoside phosphotransferase (APT) family kinase protein